MSIFAHGYFAFKFVLVYNYAIIDLFVVILLYMFYILSMCILCHLKPVIEISSMVISWGGGSVLHQIFGTQVQHTNFF